MYCSFCLKRSMGTRVSRVGAQRNDGNVARCAITTVKYGVLLLVCLVLRLLALLVEIPPVEFRHHLLMGGFAALVGDLAYVKGTRQRLAQSAREIVPQYAEIP